MSVISYRQFINRDLPRIERGCTSKAIFVSRGEAPSVRRNRQRWRAASMPLPLLC
jgi:hypothetical protein